MSTVSAIPSQGRASKPGASTPYLARGLAAPFDLARDVHAHAVKAGLIERSLLENARFEHQLDALEHLVLGPFARTR